MQSLPRPFRNVPVAFIEANQSLNKLRLLQIPVSFGQAVGSRETAKQQKPGQGEIAASLSLTYSGY